MNMMRNLALVVCTGTFLLASTGTFSFRHLGLYPNSAISVPRGLNSSKVSVGFDLQTDGNYHGYVKIGKNFITIQPPGSSSSYLEGINDKGEMVGGYCDTVNCGGITVQHGFLYKSGKYTKLDYPIAGTPLAAFGINNLGQVVGGYCPGLTTCSGGISPSNHAFLLKGGAFTTLDYPGAIGTQANAINDAGTIVGFYEEHSTQQHGYMYLNGVFTQLDFPGANWTYPAGINNAGTVAGSFQDRNYIVHGFIYSGGVFTQIDVPNAFSTAIGGINNKGEITAGADMNNSTVGNFIGTPTSPP
jgi:probable HAF family extracellular repeat protein